jgi:hypothetical protein
MSKPNLNLCDVADIETSYNDYAKNFLSLPENGFSPSGLIYYFNTQKLRGTGPHLMCGKGRVICITFPQKQIR